MVDTRRESESVDPVVEAYKADIDRSLLRVNLRRTVQERLQTLIEMGRLADEARAAGARARASESGRDRE